MTTTSTNELSNDQVRAINGRFLRHAFDHLPGLGMRTGVIALRNGLLKRLPNELFSAELLEVLKSPSHTRRMSQSVGPYLVFHEGERKRSLIDLSDAILNPVGEIRCAALAEIERQVALQEQLISPQVKAIIDSARSALTGGELSAALSGGIQIADALDADYFFAAARLRQCSALGYFDDVALCVRTILLPSLPSLDFLRRHPLSSKQEGLETAQSKCEAIIDGATTLDKLLNDYFFYFGFLPLGADLSAGGVFRRWCERGHNVDKLWESIWQWANSTGSPLAEYHACQLLCANAARLSNTDRQNLSSRAWEVVMGETSDMKWRLRIFLARHFMRHFELSAFAVDGERAAVFSWWLAEYTATLIYEVTKEARSHVTAECDAILGSTAQLWNLARPATTPSRLRTATLCEPSPWSRAMLVELGNSPIAKLSPSASCISDETNQQAPPFVPFPASMVDYVPFAFDGPGQGALDELDHRRGSPASDMSAVIASIWSQPITAQEQAKQWTELLSTGDAIQRAGAAEVFKQWASLGVWDVDVIWQTLATEDGRYQLLCNSDADCEALCSALIETMWRDVSHDWRSYLPHYFALAAQDTRLSPEQRSRIVDATVIACVATNSCSAIQRLLAGNRRTGIRSDIQRAKNTLDSLYSKASPSLMARFRAVSTAFRMV